MKQAHWTAVLLTSISCGREYNQNSPSELVKNGCNVRSPVCSISSTVAMDCLPVQSHGAPRSQCEISAVEGQSPDCWMQRTSRWRFTRLRVEPIKVRESQSISELRFLTRVLRQDFRSLNFFDTLAIEQLHLLIAPLFLVWRDWIAVNRHGIWQWRRRTPDCNRFP